MAIKVKITALNERLPVTFEFLHKSDIIYGTTSKLQNIVYTMDIVVLLPCNLHPHSNT
jgi:hypothetical protein